MKFDLPYPPSTLSPNARLHWAAKAKAVKAYRRECFVLALAARGAQKWDSLSGPLCVVIRFHPPDSRRRDRDNMVAAFKGGADGVADAIGIDDARWMPVYLVGEPVKGGKVTFEIETGETNEQRTTPKRSANT
jgi:crossover junction endodeoxyribonuclease RusA